jgi:hypothetical protein
MYVKIKKKKYTTNGSILATIQVLQDIPTEDTGLFVVTQANDLDPTVVNNLRFLSVASASDIQEYGLVPIFPGIYRTDTITVCIKTEAKYTAFITTLMEDLNKAGVLAALDFTDEVEYTLTDTGDLPGPFLFSSLEP